VTAYHAFFTAFSKCFDINPNSAGTFQIDNKTQVGA